MSQIGSFALLLALALCAYSFLAGLLALARPGTGSERLGETARRAGVAAFAVVLLAAVVLVIAAFQDDFSIAYIFHHSNRDLPAPYKFATLWSGQEGSLLFWSLLLSTYGLVLRLRHKTDTRLFAHASVIIAAVQVFFLLLLNFAAHPFAIMQGSLPDDGNGLNPLLQYPEMVIHPPMLYLGYVGFSIPFAFGLGALMMRYPGEKWIKITRVWTMVTWLFLTCGIFLGMHWAYAVLGWGGYWGWDPVENASFMPWLTGTAFLHSVMMQERKGMMKVWNVWLIFATFMLSILGTLLTRSGLVSSVHAFAQSSIGDWFYAFLLLVLVVCIFTFILQRDHLKSDHKIESLVSRESSFLFNNLIFLAACFTILWGTLFPVLSEYVQGSKVTVGAPWYNRIAVPIGLGLLALMGLGPLLAWRSSSLRSIRRNFVLPSIATITTAVALLAIGERPWQDQGPLYSFVAFSVAAGVITAISSEFLRGAHVLKVQTGRNIFAATLLLIQRNTRRYGGYIVHFGVVVIFIGLAGSAFNRSTEQEMNFRQSMQVGPYTLVCQDYTQDTNPNYDSEYALLDVYRNGKKVTQLAPEKRFYVASQQVSTMVANHSTLAWDLYVIYAGQNPDTNRPIIKVFLNPLVAWIWIGVVIVILGTLVALVPNLTTVLSPARARQRAKGSARSLVNEPATLRGGD